MKCNAHYFYSECELGASCYIQGPEFLEVKFYVIFPFLLPVSDREQSSKFFIEYMNMIKGSDRVNRTVNI
jgi:hypothetical protein